MSTHYHLVGIGGAGVSAIARSLLAHGTVSGSDQGGWPLAEALVPLGVTVFRDFDAAHVGAADVVIRSSAYGERNPEVAAALARGIPVWRRHEAWQFLARGREVIAVAGTHGKTTTTALLWTALRVGGRDPSLLCGAELRGLGANAHTGAGSELVIEADEYDRTFLALSPVLAVVTNVEHDHVDVYPTVAEYQEAFRELAGRIVDGGRLVACADDEGARALASWASDALPAVEVVTYGLGEVAQARIADVSEEGPVTCFAVRWDGSQTTVRLPLRGMHNVRNGTAAIVAAVLRGVPADEAAAALATFAGTARRLETLGSANGITVVDDYAHHPTEIRASLAALRTSTRGRLIALFQPHTPSRLAAFFDDFGHALRTADAVVVLETFASVRESSDRGTGARALAGLAGGEYATDAEHAARLLVSMARPGDTVAVLGAGDIRPAGERLLELLRRQNAA